MAGLSEKATIRLVRVLFVVSCVVNIVLIGVIVGMALTRRQHCDNTHGAANPTNRSATAREGADPTAIYWGRFEPTATAIQAIPYKNFRIRIFQAAAAVNPNPLNSRNDLYYFTPAVILNASSAVHSNNKFAGKYQVEFSITMWDGDYLDFIKKTLSARLNVPNPKLRIIPIEEVRIDLVGTDWPPEYEIDNNWRPYSMAPTSVSFRIFCATKNLCLDLRDDIQNSPRHFAADLVMYFNLQSKSSSARRLTVNVEHVRSGKLFTEMRTRFTGTSDVYLNGDDAKQLTSEIATNLLAAEISDAEFVDQQNSPKLMQLIETALEMTTESTKNFDARQWGSVFWKDENARPDKVTYRLNDAYSKLSTESKLLIKEAYEKKDGTNTCFNLEGKYESGKGEGGDDGGGEDDGGEEARQRAYQNASIKTGENFHDPLHSMRQIQDDGDCGCPQLDCQGTDCNLVNTAKPTPLTTTTRRTTTPTTTPTPSTRAPRPTRVTTTPESADDDEGIPTHPKTTSSTKKPATTTTEKPEKEKDQERDISGSLEGCISKSNEVKDKKHQEEFNRAFQESKNYSEFRGDKFEVKTMNLRRMNLASLVSKTSFETSSIRLSTANVVMKNNINLDDDNAAANVVDTSLAAGSSIDTGKSDLGKDMREVYYVRANVTATGFHYTHAVHLCKSLGARLATAEDMRRAFINGADWCKTGLVDSGDKTVVSMHPSRSCSTVGGGGGEAPEEAYAPEVCVADAVKVKAAVIQEVLPVKRENQEDKNGFLNGVNCYGIKPAQEDEVYYSGVRVFISEFRRRKQYAQTNA